MKRILNWLSVHGNGDGDCDGGVGARVTRWRVRVRATELLNSNGRTARNWCQKTDINAFSVSKPVDPVTGGEGGGGLSVEFRTSNECVYTCQKDNTVLSFPFGLYASSVGVPTDCRSA